MSSANTKASKIARVRVTQLEHGAYFEDLFALMRLNHKTDTATIAEQAAIIEKLTAANLELTATNTLLATVAQSLEAQLNRLRKYVGSILFKRRQFMAGTLKDVRIPVLHDAQEPKWGNR